ncbi:retrotransposon gag protein [Cucumis melo var. makuwa]|uniref:Retrotransposon gag protein n=1 Tax=Cucumis melo var. makuwa TaxID=1194695 RepID=A0A5A7VCR0_CUCMM|nr:retrotransposon gag protein [Cucumis melo var. makuwa]
MRMPNGYQPPKFQQLDGKGNPKQYVAHFIETYETAGTRGDLLDKQFVRTLKGNAFDYMMELTNTRQQKGELVIDYINRWRALSLDCKDRLTELSAVEMCTQGMHWGLIYILQGIKPRTFEELATRAHDMELSITNRGAKDFLIPKSRSDKNELDDTKKIANSVIKESMVVHATPLKSFSKIKETKIERKHDGDEKRRSTLKERQEKVYPFPDSDVANMLEQLLENQFIQLPECKRPEQAGKVDDPNYCKYHQIELDIDEVAQTNHVAIEMTSNVPPLTQLDDQRKSLIQFGTSAPILVLFQQRIVTINSQNKEAHGKDDGKGWITVTHQKGRQPNSIQKESRFHQKYVKGSISHKKKGRRNKKMWNPKPIKGKDDDFLQLRRSITLAEFLPRSFLEDHQEEILEVTACHAASIVEVDNNYGSSKEVNNSNEINQRTSVFDRIKSSTTRSLVFQRLSMATKKEENQCPTFIYTRTSAFKRLSISTSKKYRPSTSVFDRLKMTNDQQQREMKSLKAKPFREENDDDKIHSRVPSRMKRKLSVDINTESAASTLHQNVDQRTLLLFDMLQARIFPCVAAKRIFIFIFSHVLQLRDLSSSSSHMYYNREDLHLHLLSCVAAERIFIFIFSNMLQPKRSLSQQRRSSSQIYYNRKDRRLKYVAAKKVIVSDMLQSRKSSSHICCSRGCRHLKYIVAEKVVPSNMLQLRRSLFLNMLQQRRSSSQICCSQECRRLIYVATENVIVSNMLQSRSQEDRRLKYVTAKKIIVSNVLQPRGSSSSSSHMCSCPRHSSSSSSMWRGADDHHLQGGTAKMIIIFIFNASCIVYHEQIPDVDKAVGRHDRVASSIMNKSQTLIKLGRHDRVASSIMNKSQTLTKQ